MHAVGFLKNVLGAGELLNLRLNHIALLKLSFGMNLDGFCPVSKRQKLEITLIDSECPREE